MAELRFDGKVALVTGAGRGLGRSYALALAERGARLLVNDPGTDLAGNGEDKGPAQSVMAEIIERGGTAAANFGSVAETSSAQAMVQQAIDAFGRIDIIVNNAGNFQSNLDLDDTSNAVFESLWRVHVLGSVNVIRAAWPHMVGQGSGRIVNIGSHVGYLGSRGKLAYGAAKGAIHGLTRSLALEAAEHGIAVNLVAPAGLTRPVHELNIPESFRGGAFAADLVAPAIVWVAHDQCTANGEAFGAMAGTVTRIRIAETPGYSSTSPTPELVRDNASRIFDQPRGDESGFVFGITGDLRGVDLVEKYLQAGS